MQRTQKLRRSLENYLATVNCSSYEDLRSCIQADTVWQEGSIRRNPTAYEIFATHEHLDFVREDIFRFSGLVPDSDAFAAAAEKVRAIWIHGLPQQFPGYDFVVFLDPSQKELAFCRKRAGVTDDPAEIRACLEHPHRYMRWNALHSAAAFPDPALIPWLVKALDDEDDYNRLKAVTALGSCRAASCLGEITGRFLKTEQGPDGKYYVNDFFAYDLFRTLIELSEEGYQAVLALFRKHRTLDSDTLDNLCEPMGNTGRPEVRDILLEIYLHNEEAGESALKGLLNMEKEAFPCILPLLADKDPIIRRKAVWFIANSYLLHARPHLVSAAGDRNSGVREAAVHGLGRFYHRARKQLLLKALDDKAAAVRVKAVEALAGLCDTKLLPVLEELCRDKNPQVRMAAMRATASLNSRRGLRFLSGLYDLVDKTERLRLIQALYSYTGPQNHLKPLVTKALASGDRRIVRETNDLLEIL